MPKYLSGDMTLGDVTQAAAAFVQVQSAFNWLVDNYPRFADWMAWLVPVTGVAAVTLLATLHPWQSGSATSGVTEASAMTYTSETDGVTIHWID